MKLLSSLKFAKNIIQSTVQQGDCAIDATAGNGNDTLLLAELVGDTGKVFAFDVQTAAIASTSTLLIQNSIQHRVTMVHAGHETMTRHVPQEFHGTITAVMFNTGYLPRSDKRIITQPETTLTALRQSMELLAPNGIITLVSYLGHEGGMEEYNAIMEFFIQIPQEQYSVMHYLSINQRHTPPELFLIQKL